MNSSLIHATYLIETARGLEQTAELIAGEQSSGTFVAVPGETAQLRARSRARVLSLEPLDEVAQSSLPGARYAANAPIIRARLKIAFPLDNVGLNLPTVLAMVCGNLFELAELSGCKLLDLELPEQFASRYPGPRFGIEGTRRLIGVAKRPLLGTIIKPSVGLSPAQTAVMVRQLGLAGIDFIKDDELMANPPHSPLAERVACIMKEIQRLADESGRKIMYAFNITDEIDAMRRHHDLVAESGGTCVMASINHVGLTGMSALRTSSQLPIHGHRNGWGMLTRHPALGIEFTAYQKLWRAVGVDHLHVNGLQNKFWEPDDSVVQSIKAMQQPLWGGYQALPVISSGQWGGQAIETYRRIASQDILYLAGGGIAAHPLGPAAGVRAIQHAWQAAVDGLSLEEAAAKSEELRLSIQKFGQATRAM